VLIIVAAETIHPGMFWLEMQSAFSEGTEEGTGEDRWELWMAAVEVFWQRPIFGVGFNNFGPFAASYFSEGDVGGRYAFNVGGLYNRSLHSLYFQTLSETGIVGSIAFIWILVDFWKRNKVLRTAAAQHYWSSIGGTFRLRQAALALELGMVGFLTVAALYSTAGKHWLWTLLALNVLLHRQVVAAAAADGVRLTGGSSAAARRKAAAQSAAAPTPELIAALAAAGPPASEQRP